MSKKVNGENGKAKEKVKLLFTVTDTENGSKPIVYATMVDPIVRLDHEAAIECIGDWIDGGLELDNMMTVDELSDVAYAMRKEGFGWYAERWCFELTDMDKSYE